MKEPLADPSVPAPPPPQTDYLPQAMSTATPQIHKSKTNK